MPDSEAKEPGPMAAPVFARRKGFRCLYLIPVEISTNSEQLFLGNELRLLDRYELQAELVAALEATKDHRHLVPRAAACHHKFRHWRCSEGHDWAEAEGSCSLRLCPHCSHRRSRVLVGRIEKAVIGKDRLRFATFSERNCVDLAEGIASLWASWARLRRSKCWKKYVVGSIVAFECTRNVEQGTWHPHLHVLMEGEFFPVEELRQRWVKATRGRGEVVDIRQAYDVRELVKYVTKFADLIGDPAALDELLRAIHRMRVLRTYGTFFGLNVEDEENPGIECPDCAGEGVHSSVVMLGYVPAYQISLDFAGVLRVARSRSAIASDLADAVCFPARFNVPRNHRHVETERQSLDQIWSA